MPIESGRASCRSREALFAAALVTHLVAGGASGQDAFEPMPQTSKDGPSLRFDFPEMKNGCVHGQRTDLLRQGPNVPADRGRGRPLHRRVACARCDPVRRVGRPDERADARPRTVGHSCDTSPRGYALPVNGNAGRYGTKCTFVVSPRHPDLTDRGVSRAHEESRTRWGQADSKQVNADSDLR